MAIFKVYAVRMTDGEEREFFYDNIASTLKDGDGNDLVPGEAIESTPAVAVSKASPGKKVSPRKLKISLGLSCNYACEYCSQRFVPHADATNRDDVQPFIDGLDGWVKTPPEQIEFWGGEPLVYIKTLIPLAEALRKKYPDARFLMITNGSLLNPETNLWLYRMGFNIGISHDATGQSVRGPDPFDDDESRQGIIGLYSMLKPEGRISFNTMMHSGNQSRADVQRFWTERFGESVVVGEGGFIDPYDEGGFSSSLQSSADQIKYRVRAMEEIRQGAVGNFDIVRVKLNGFVSSLVDRRNAYSLGQKCGMDKEENIAVDLKGNVLTCQNVSAASNGMNGESHKIGHVSEFEKIQLKTATHWSERKDCKTCPVLQLCQGSCMFLEGPLWDAGCANSYSDNIPYFAGAIEHLTGFLPYRIEHDSLPEDRKDLWTVPVDTNTKEFPIKVVSA